MISQKLKQGDEVRVISPSRSLAIISKETREIAIKKFKELGLKLSFSKNVEESNEFNSSSIKSRVQDLHDAFKDKNVKAIITTIGGFNSNQILKYIDYKVIKNNPKILCGYSDITALLNAIYAKTGLVGYYGPHFSSFGMKKGIEYTSEYFKKCLFSNEIIEIESSKEWSDDSWYMDQEKRKFIKNNGFLLINEGKAEGTIIGGNLCTFNLLQGTEFMPSLKDAILFLEDDEMAKDYTVVDFDRNLQSVLHLPGSNKIKGIVLGRFQIASEMTPDKIMKIIKTKKELINVPVIANVDFGHTTPQITFPIGGKVSIVANKNKIQIKITKH
ncbi:MAG: S66 peptidase family protein [Nanoarchaeota archaeon]